MGIMIAGACQPVARENLEKTKRSCRHSVRGAGHPQMTRLKNHRAAPAGDDLARLALDLEPQLGAARRDPVEEQEPVVGFSCQRTAEHPATMSTRAVYGCSCEMRYFDGRL